MAVGDPINWNDIQTIRDFTVGMPLVRLIQTVAQALGAGVATAITFTTEDVDTHGFHDNSTNPSRVTPTVAGYYRITGSVWAQSASGASVEAVIRKNGTVIPASGRDLPGAANTRCALATVIQTANGTSDYFEVYGNFASAASTVVGSQQASTLEVEFLRPL